MSDYEFRIHSTSYNVKVAMRHVGEDVFPVYVMKAYTALELEIPLFLIPALKGGEWPTSRVTCTPGKGYQYPLKRRKVVPYNRSEDFWRKE